MSSLTTARQLLMWALSQLHSRAQGRDCELWSSDPCSVTHLLWDQVHQTFSVLAIIVPNSELHSHRWYYFIDKNKSLAIVDRVLMASSKHPSSFIPASIQKVFSRPSPCGLFIQQGLVQVLLPSSSTVNLLISSVFLEVLSPDQHNHMLCPFLSPSSFPFPSGL